MSKTLESYLEREDVPADVKEGIKRDLSEREQAEEGRFRALTENSTDVTMILDKKGVYKYISPAVQRIFGYSIDEAIGNHVTEIIHPGDLSIVQESFELAIQYTNETIKVDCVRVQHRDGSWIYLESLVTGMIGITGVDGVVVSCRDITDRIQAEKKLKQTMKELEQFNADLELFAYNISHDLQEPLRMVSSYVQLIEDRYKGKLDADADEFIAFAVEGTTRMQKMINDLLAYSRVGTRARPLERTDLETIFAYVFSNLQIAIEENNALVTHDPLPEVMADTSQMIQLFQNLIGNAIKFRSEVPPEIHVGVERKENEWIFFVRDNGIGFEPRHSKRIFQVFQRLHTRDEYPGTGIGLSICRKIVERHNGRIWAESEPGKGSIFYFSLPCMEQPG
ncbi:MAG: ATP-binding protein [Candidatus Hodarchaeota archaeon]